VNYTYSGAARPLSAIDPTGPINYVTAATYAPQGSLSTFTNGSNIGAAITYNSRLQPLQMYFTAGAVSSGTLTQMRQTTCPTTVATIMSRSYNVGLGTGDNGNVNSITNCRDTNRSQNFTYDSLSRIQSAYTTGSNWGEDFTIDAWGNLTNRALHSGKNTYESLNAPALPNNQLSGFGYDAGGNMTSNGGAAYTYDAEDHLTKFVGGSTNNYSYDGDGQRVEKTGPVGLYWYGATGDVLEETGSTGALTSEYIFFNGKRVARRDADNSVHYYFSDHLGSHGVVTNSSGACEQDIDYYPFGGIEHDYCQNSTQHYKFTGKERDAESGLDNFGARYNVSSLGRFMTPDLVTMLPERLHDPQQINLYAYTRNNPLRFVDPTGTTIDDSACQADKKCKKWEAEYKKSKEGLAQWKKLDDDKKLLVKLKWDSKGKESVASDYRWDAAGKLTAATVTLAPHTADSSTQMNSDSYPFGSTLTDSNERRVYVFGHELAHVEDADTPEGSNSIQEVQRLFPDADARFKAEGLSGYEQDKDLQATFGIIRADNKRNENVADQCAKGIVESYRTCESSKGCK
jgi:RHS repeat-associated protein